MCSDFFERSFNNPKFMESQSKSITMKGCTEAAMKAIVDYIYTGDTDLSNYDLATLLRIMNISLRRFLLKMTYSTESKHSSGTFCQGMKPNQS